MAELIAEMSGPVDDRKDIDRADPWADDDLLEQDYDPALEYDSGMGDDRGEPEPEQRPGGEAPPRRGRHRTSGITPPTCRAAASSTDEAPPPLAEEDLPWAAQGPKPGPDFGWVNDYKTNTCGIVRACVWSPGEI